MEVNVIAALNKDNVIGINNGLPWKLKNDLKHFRELTTTHAVIMGRNTFDSIGKALPNRRNIVVSKTMTEHNIENISVVDSVENAIKLAEHYKCEKAFIIGGAQIYKYTLENIDIDNMYLTYVKANIEGDTHFPIFDHRDWFMKELKHVPADNDNEYDATYYRLY